MDETITVREVMSRTYVGVTEGDTVAGAAGLLREEGAAGAVVLRGSEPVGVLSPREFVALVADGRDPEATPVGDVMAAPAVSVAADRRIGAALAALAEADVRQLAVVDDGEVVGLLSDHDLVTAAATFRERDGDASPDEPLPDETRAADQVAEYATQGVCEVCGALAADLSAVDGQLRCADCRDL